MECVDSITTTWPEAFAFGCAALTIAWVIGKFLDAF